MQTPILKGPTVRRRDFLRLGALGVSVASTYPAFVGKTAAATGEANPLDDRVLVVLQLSGGNDGLSTVVPYSDPAYGRAREINRLREESVLNIDERVGLHPNLAELKEIYDEGRMAIVQGTSYPNPTRSHFESMDIWHAADRIGARRGSGWLGRAIDSTCGNRMNPLLSVCLGSEVPLALEGERSKPLTFQRPGSYQWRGSRQQRDAFLRLNSPSPESKTSGSIRQIDFLRQVAADANASSQDIRKATQGYRPVAPYPMGNRSRGNRLGAELRLVAAMIAARLPTRVFYVSLGGFDTHANQRGRHDNLMTILSKGLAAFLEDLKAQSLLDRVVVLAFSEFGRRVKENASRGTDHGVAGPMLLFGGGVRGGLHGAHPSLTDLVNGDLAMTSDFRQVYATVLDDWLGISSGEVLGKDWGWLPLFQTERLRAF